MTGGLWSVYVNSAAPGQAVCACLPGNGGYVQETTSESSWCRVLR